MFRLTFLLILLATTISSNVTPTCYNLARCLETPTKKVLTDDVTVRKHELLERLVSTPHPPRGSKFDGYDLIAQAALKGCADQRQLDTFLSEINQPIDMFVRPVITRYLIGFSQCVNDVEKARMLDVAGFGDQLFLHGTINHALMSSSSYFIIAERYPQLKWFDRNGTVYSSRQVMVKYRFLLLDRLQHFLESGFNEQLSPTYSPIDAFCLLNLVDYAKDPQIKDAAEKVIDAIIALWGIDSFEGAILPPLARENAPGQNSSIPPSVARDVLWLYFGGFQLPEEDTPEPAYSAMFAASHWIPPLNVLNVKRNSPDKYDAKITTPFFTTWGGREKIELAGQAHVEKDFAIGSGNRFSQPSGADDHTVLFRIYIRGLFPVGSIDCSNITLNNLPTKGARQQDGHFVSSQFAIPKGSMGFLLYSLVEPNLSAFSVRPTSRPEYGTSDVSSKSPNNTVEVAECRFPDNPAEITTATDRIILRYGHVGVAFRLFGGEASFSIIKTAPNSNPYILMRIFGRDVSLLYRASSLRPDEKLENVEEKMDDAYNQLGNDKWTAETEKSQIISFNQRDRYTDSAQTAQFPILASETVKWANGSLKFRNGPEIGK